MKRILVTGGAGFIGSHLCKKLVDVKYDIADAGGYGEYVFTTH